MGMSLFYPRLSRLGIYPATRWNLALPCEPSTLSEGSAFPTQWLSACAVCCAHRPLPLLSSGAQCQESSNTIKPRRVSAVLWPLSSSPSDASPPPDTALALLPSAPVLWKDWPRSDIRRTWLKVVRSQTVCVESSSQISPSLAKAPTEKILTRAERAHWRLSWQQRLARNTRPPDAPRLVVTLHGLPAIFASSFGFDLLATT